MNEALVSLTSNVILILGLALIYGMFIPFFQRLPDQMTNILFGLIFGFFAILNMMAPVEISPGVRLDLRIPLVIIAGIHGGWQGVLAAALPVAIYRSMLGGAGALPSLLSLLMIITIPLIYNHYFRSRWRLSLLVWIGMSLIAVIFIILWSTILLPPHINRTFIETFIPPTLILYPVTLWFTHYLIQREKDRILLSEALGQSERRFKAIFNQTFQFIGLLEPDGILIEANDTALKFANAQREDVVGKYFWEAPWWSFSEATQEQLKEAIRNSAKGEFIRYQVDVAGANGKVITIDFSLQPIFDEQSNVILMIPEGRDISGEILAEKRRVELVIEKERNELMRQFIQDSSHHLRTPITVLQSSIDLFERTQEKIIQSASNLRPLFEQREDALFTSESDNMVGLLEKNRSRIRKFQLGINKLTELVTNMLNLAQLEMPEETILEPVDLSELIATEFKRYHELAKQKAVRIVVQSPETGVYLHADRYWISLVVQNTVENALHYTPENGEVSISFRVSGENAVFQVKDTGIGIPPGETEDVFSQFYRASNAQTMNSQGSGLGLSIVKKIVEAHEGSITVESDLLTGTTFTITLPLDPQKVKVSSWITPG